MKGNARTIKSIGIV